MERREFLKLSAATALAAAMPEANAGQTVEKPNIIFIVADQRCYGLSKATGYPLDTSPTLDRMQTEGIGFERNYCTMPACVPSRTSMLTGRWPEAHHVRMNLQAKAAYFEKDLYQVAKGRGYKTALIGKNHSYLSKDDVDAWHEYFHEGSGPDPNKPKAFADFDKWLDGLHFNISEEPTPFPLTSQLPYRIVSDSIDFIDAAGDQPFLLQISIPEPHDPEQVPAPYWNMFPPETLPERCAGPEALPKLGYRAQWNYQMQQDYFPDTEKMWRRYRSNYLGCLRMIDDQIERLVEHLDAKALTKKTLIVFTSDHGDSFMDYGIGHKGVDVKETVTHTPYIWSGYGVKHNKAALEAFTSMADMMPTLCEVMGAEIRTACKVEAFGRCCAGKTSHARSSAASMAGLGWAVCTMRHPTTCRPRSDTTQIGKVRSTS